MSVQEGWSDVGYCKPEDVLDYFEKIDEATTGTTPSRDRIEAMILSWSDYIDRKTGHAWRERKVVNEFHDLDTAYYYWAGKPISLMKREIRDFDESKGDKIEIWRGGEYQDLVSDPARKQGRDGHYWLDGPNGILYIYERLIYPRTRGIKITYRYGHGTDSQNERETIPKDIEMACAKLVAKDITTSEKYDVVIPGSEGGSDNQRIAEQWENDVEETLKRRKEIRNAL